VTNRSGNKYSDNLTIQVMGSVTDDPCDIIPTVQSKNPWGMWNHPSAWDTGIVPTKNDWVLIQSEHLVILPPTDQISVKGLCIAENGVLQSYFNTSATPSSVHLSAATIRNKGSILAMSGIEGSLFNGSYRHATAGSRIKLYANRFLNDTTGKIGNGHGGNDRPYLYFTNWSPVNARGGDGGSVEIYPVVFTNHGLIQGGNGGAGDTVLDGGQLVDGDAQGGHGGAVQIFATNLAMSSNSATGRIKGGTGGYADGITSWLQAVIFDRNWLGWLEWRVGTWHAVYGGKGGNVSANLGHFSGMISGANGSTTYRRVVLPTTWIRSDQR
jgi:hypothetical protein